jgi:hypothetical protein
MQIERSQIDRIEGVLNAETDTFSDLVKISGLNPSQDFRMADLSFVDFSGSDLSDFDFEFSDLRNASWKGVVNHPKNYRIAMRGRAHDPVSGRDFPDWVARVHSGRIWAERFFAFKCVVDNFGENELTLDLLHQVLSRDKSLYMRSTCTVYLAASLFRIDEMLNYCSEMAFGSNAKVNMFRMMRLRRYARELSRVIGSIPVQSEAPGHLEGKQLSAEVALIWQREKQTEFS